MAGRRKNGEGSYGVKNIKGKVYQYYRTTGGKYIYATTQKELREKIKAYNTNVEHNTTNDKTTVYRYALMWLDSIKKSVKSKTYDGYESYINNIINNNKYMFGGMQIKDVKTKHIQDFINDIADDYSRATINKCKIILNMIFEKAVDDNIVRSNPVRKIRLPKEENVGVSKKDIQIFEHDDIIKFKNEAQRKYANNKYIYGINSSVALFVLNTGLRFGEVTQLSWEDVDFDKKEIHINSSSSYVKNREKDGNNYITIKTTPKSKNSIRKVPLNNEAYNILKNLYKDNYKMTDLIFSSGNNSYISNSNLNRTIRSICKAANCDNQNMSIHGLRHTFASQLLANGVEISVVSKLLGHSQVSTTYNNYIHIIENSDKRAVNILNDIY